MRQIFGKKIIQETCNFFCTFRSLSQQIIILSRFKYLISHKIKKLKHLVLWRNLVSPIWDSIHRRKCQSHLVQHFRDLKIRRRRQEHQKAIGLVTKITILYVHHAFLYITLLLLHDYDVKMPNFTLYRERTNFLSLSELGFGSQEFNFRRVHLHLTMLATCIGVIY